MNKHWDGTVTKRDCQWLSDKIVRSWIPYDSDNEIAAVEMNTNNKVRLTVLLFFLLLRYFFFFFFVSSFFFFDPQTKFRTEEEIIYSLNRMVSFFFLLFFSFNAIFLREIIRQILPSFKNIFLRFSFWYFLSFVSFNFYLFSIF